MRDEPPTPPPSRRAPACLPAISEAQPCCPVAPERAKERPLPPWSSPAASACAQRLSYLGSKRAGRIGDKAGAAYQALPALHTKTLHWQLRVGSAK